MIKWDERKLESHGGEEKWYTLQNKIPVYIGYFTAWVDDKDEIHFEDIYKRDDELASLLFHQITIQNVNECDHSQKPIFLRFLIR
jgi:murein L,D-transpeptidase YcbB/YkuD